MQQRFWIVLVSVFALFLGLTIARADDEKLTTPKESLGGLRPGTLTVDQLSTKFGKPDVVDTGGLLSLYGGAEESEVYGWYMIENPDYTIPDLAVETAQGSDRVDLVMAIGYDGLKTEKGITCFMTEDEMVKAYGKPDFVFAVPMNGYVLREAYYIDEGVSFDLAATGTDPDRQVIAIYVTYPEYLKKAVDIRHDYIDRGVGKDVTAAYGGGTLA